MNDDIISLCYVRNRGERSVEVCRFADLDTSSGKFYPYTFHRDKDFYDTERDLLYGSPSLNGLLDSIDIYSWHSYQDSNNNSWRTDVRNCDIDWVEVITSTLDTPEKIVKLIVNGWLPPYPLSTRHTLLIACQTISSQSIGVLIPRDSLVLRDGRYYFNDNIIVLKTCAINLNRDTAQCIYRNAQDTNRRYLIRLDGINPTSTVAVQNPDSVINTVIQAYIQKIDQALITRKEKQAARSALNKLSVPTVVDNVAARLQCPAKHAQKLVDQYLFTSQKLLNDDTALGLIDTLIANDSSYVQTLRIKAAEDWQAKQDVLLSEAKERLGASQAQLENIQTRAKNAKDELEKAERRRIVSEAQTEDVIKLQAEIEEQIKQRLSSLAQDRAAALVDTALLQAALPPREISASTAVPQTVLPGFFIDAPERSDTLINSEIADSMVDAETAWKELCGIEGIASEITAFCFAAYSCKQPLLFIGEASEAAADLYSFSVCGMPCAKVWLSNKTDETALFTAIKNAPHDFICIENGLERGYDTVRRLMRHFSESAFVVTVPHAEALAMEPDSLFTTFFPVPLDCFCTDICFHAPQPFRCADELRQGKFAQPDVRELAKVLGIQQKWFTEGFNSMLLRRRCAKISYCMTQLYRMNVLSAGSAEEATLVFIFFPLMKFLNRKKSISQVFEKVTGVDENLQEIMLSYAGIAKESE